MSAGTAAEETVLDTSYRLIVGDCRIEMTGDAEQTYRGSVVVLLKPDGTVLIHDVAGYKPVAWITRAESVSANDQRDIITAVDGDQWLRVKIDQAVVDRQLPGSPAGRPIDVCPECAGPLVSVRDAIHCVSCHERYGLPSGATVLERSCHCGLPKIRVERGEAFELCVDRACDPLDEKIAEQFDGVWTCPETECDGTLRVIRRGGLLLGCDCYPECETAFRFPAGILDGHCGCGLPRFVTNGKSRCLDGTCESA